MRILLVTHRFLPRFLAGTEVYAGSLAESLKDRGHTVQVFTGDPSATEASTYDWNGMVVHVVPWRAGRAADPISTFLAGFLNPPVERRFEQVSSDFKPDIVHIHHLIGLSPRLPAIARAHGARVIVTLHDYWFKCSNTLLFRYSDELCPGPGLGYHCGGCALQRLGRKPNRPAMILAAPIFVLRTAVLRRVLSRVDCVIVPSQAAARVFAPDRLLAGKLRVIPHGLSTRQPAPPAAAPGANRPPRYVYVGSVVRPKGVHVIVQAFANLTDAGQELHVYGDLSVDAAYVDQLRKLVTRPGTFFHGALARSQVPQALGEADVVLVPSLWRETFSVIVDEAFEAGVPVLVSAGSAAAERVVAGVNGLVAPAGDVEAWREQMQRVAAEPTLLARLRAGVRPPKTLMAHALEIEAVYQNMLEEAA